MPKSSEARSSSLLCSMWGTCWYKYKLISGVLQIRWVSQHQTSKKQVKGRIWDMTQKPHCASGFPVLWKQGGFIGLPWTSSRSTGRSQSTFCPLLIHCRLLNVQWRNTKSATSSSLDAKSSNKVRASQVPLLSERLAQLSQTHYFIVLRSSVYLSSK